MAADDLVAFVGMSDLDATLAVATDTQKRRYADVVKAYTSFEDGDLLVAKITPCFENGKIAQAAVSTQLAFGSTEFHVLRPIGDKVEGRYLLHFLRRPIVLKLGENRMTGAGGQRRVPARFFDELEIPLPPIEEQRRIASILDAADALRTKRRQALAKLDTLTQAIFIDMFGDPIANPRNLPVYSLGDLIKLRSGSGLTAKDMKPGPYLVYGGNGVSGAHDQFMFEEPQIVIGRVGVYCGCVHVTEPLSWITDNALYVYQIKANLNRAYLAAALREANLNQFANQAAQPLISGSRVYPVTILLPSLEEQIRFEDAMQAAGAAMRKLSVSDESVEALFASLQHRAFRGEL